jgi:quinol monooxygenase YgiN
MSLDIVVVSTAEGVEMAFIQTMEIETDRPDDVMAAAAAWFEATEGKRTLRQSIMCRDRTDPNRIVVIAMFDSYESAMENSNLKETQEMATRLSGMVRAPIEFRDLDVVEERS